CELPDAMRRYKYVDYRQEAKEEFEELLAACRFETESAPPPPEVKPTKKSTQPPEQAEPLAMLERKLTGHQDWVKSVAVSPDGTWTVSGSNDLTAKIWELETGACLTTLHEHTHKVYSVAITPDGERILSASVDASIRVWDARSGRKVAKLDAHTGEVWTVVALRDNGRALSGGFDKTLRLWDLD